VNALIIASLMWPYCHGISVPLGASLVNELIRCESQTRWC